MNILVTGGAGFIGSNFVHHLLGKGFQALVVNLDKLTYAGNLENLHGLENDPRHVFVKGDIGDRALVSALLKRHEIGIVVNFAAESHVDRSIDSAEPFYVTNVMGTLALMETVREDLRARPGAIRKFVHVSTDEVYGSLSEEEPAFTEKTPFAPNSPYAASKAASDFIARSFHHTYGMPVVVTNCSNNYGPRQFPEKLIPLMVLNALEGRALPVYGDGRNIRDWLHVSDHCEAIRILLNAGVPGETYNIGGLSEVRNIDLVRMICRILDRLRPRPEGSYENLISFVKDRPGHDRRYAINISKLSALAGWKPAVSLEKGLEETVRWYLDNPGWCENITTGKYRRERLGEAKC